MKTKIIYFMAAFFMTAGPAYSMLAHRYDVRSAIHDSDKTQACKTAKDTLSDAPICNQPNDIIDGKPQNIKSSEDCDCHTTSWQDNPSAQSCNVTIEWDCETKS